MAVGQLYSDLDRYQDALASFDLALGIDPRHVRGLDQRVVALESIHRFADAEQAAVQAAQLLPHNLGHRVRHAWTLSDLDRDDEAAADAGVGGRGLIATSGEQTSLFLAPPLVVSDHELDQIFDALHHGLELADAELAATSAGGHCTR